MINGIRKSLIQDSQVLESMARKLRVLAKSEEWAEVVVQLGRIEGMSQDVRYYVNAAMTEKP